MILSHLLNFFFNYIKKNIEVLIRYFIIKLAFEIIVGFNKKDSACG